MSVSDNQPCILDPGFNLTLRPMAHEEFYQYFKTGIRNTWTVEEVDFSTDIVDLRTKMTSSEQHLIKRLVAFFATGDSIVGNNLVLNLYKHINSPEARMYLSRQLFEEAVHVQFYLTLLDTYITDSKEREEAFSAIDNIPSIKKKADFCFKWIDSINNLESLTTDEDKQAFILNLMCFAACIEGLFFFAAFAYVYYLRSRGLLQGLAAGTNWVFRDETQHIEFAVLVINTVRQQRPDLFTRELNQKIIQMMREAVDCELAFAEDTLNLGINGMSISQMKEYLEYVADRRLAALNIEPVFGSKNPFSFMDLQDVQELTNFFERRVSAYQTAITGTVDLNEDF